MSFCYKFILCSCLVGVIYAKSEAEIRAQFMTLGIECSKEHKVSADEMLQMHQHKIPDSEEAKCLLACIYRKVGWVDAKGMFDVPSANKMIEKEHLDEPHKIDNSKKLFEECSKVNSLEVTDGDKGCQRSGKLAECLIENAPKMGFDIMV